MLLLLVLFLFSTLSPAISLSFIPAVLGSLSFAIQLSLLRFSQSFKNSSNPSIQSTSSCLSGCHTTHGPVTPTSHPREISGVFMQCVGQLICIPTCHECVNAPQPSATSNRRFFNLCVAAGDKDHGIAHLCGSCLVQPDPDQTCTPSKSAFSSIRYSMLTVYSSTAKLLLVLHVLSTTFHMKPPQAAHSNIYLPVA